MGLSMDKVLVLLATYNGEKYLPQQLDSVFDQEGINTTFFVRDDGSSDDTTKILERYKRNDDLLWYQGEHLNVQKGYFELMKKAYESDFEYFAFCDQDDVWDRDKVKIGVENIKNNNCPSLYYCGQRLVDENLNFIADHTLNKDRSLKTRFVLSDFAGCTGIFNRKLLKEIVEFEPEYMLMHDTWILKVCLCLGGAVIVDPEPHMSYRQHGGNTVGLGRSVPAYLKQVKQYLNEYQVERQMHDLYRGYGDRMIFPYKEICEWICGYRENKEYRKKLLDKQNVDFCSRGLNLTYRLKVMLNKL